MDEMLKLYINQGYMPTNCTMDGMLVHLLIKDGQNPCCGCNKNCTHKICNCNTTIINQKEKDRLERINKRRVLNTNRETIVYVEIEANRSNVTVMVPDEERGYMAHFKSVEETSKYIPMICKMYNAKQVFIEMNGAGIGVYDDLCRRVEEIKDIDIVPISIRRMKLN